MPLSSLLETCAIRLFTERLNIYLITLIPRFYEPLVRATGKIGYLLKYFKIFSFSVNHLRLS